MKEGLALFLLYLHDGKELQQGSRSMLELTKHAFEFRLEEYKKGQNIKVEKTENEYFYELFLNWKDTTKIENSDEEKNTGSYRQSHEETCRGNYGSKQTELLWRVCCVHCCNR